MRKESGTRWEIGCDDVWEKTTPIEYSNVVGVV